MIKKVCNNCKVQKCLSEFWKKQGSIDGYMHQCKVCAKILREKTSIAYRRTPKAKQKMAEANVRWKENNRELLNERNRKYLAKRRSTPKGKLCNSIRVNIYQSLKGQKKGKHWENLVGYTLDDLMEHLENKFEPWMTWDNYGKWHIDHIKPIASFSFKSFEDQSFKDCWALSNLQPLSAHENLRKSDKYALC